MSYHINSDKLVPALAHCLMQHGSMLAIQNYIRDYERNGGSDVTVCLEFMVTNGISGRPNREAMIAEAMALAEELLEESRVESAGAHEKQLYEALKRMKKVDPSVPSSISKIPGFPFSNFVEMQKAIRAHKFVIASFSFHHDFDILGLVSPGRRHLYLVSMFATFIVPLVSVILAFVISHLFWFGLLYFFIGTKITTRVWKNAVLRAAYSSECAFCLLFYTSKINAYDPANSTEYEWQQLTNNFKEPRKTKASQPNEAISTLVNGSDLIANVTAALKELELEHPYAIKAIRNEVMVAIGKNQPEVLRQLKLGVVQPRDVARQFSCNVAGDLLEAGRYHVYRGILTDEGQALLLLYTSCWREDAARKFTTIAKAEEEISSMNQIIREVG